MIYNIWRIFRLLGGAALQGYVFEQVEKLNNKYFELHVELVKLWQDPL
jgi:hypothetical protein